MKIKGVMLPIITPFKNGEVDFDSYEKMINYYSETGITGLVPLGTTGESPTVSQVEYEKIIEKTIEFNKKNLPIYVGFGGNDTISLTKRVKLLEKYNIQGILSVSPYYNRPDQRGIYEHFKRLSESTCLDIILYNIPYRTGRNIENDTIRRLSEFKNIVALKDACGNFSQSSELLLDRPENFSILTGEDVFYFNSLVMGGDGGILASAHLNTCDFIKVYNLVNHNKHKEAFDIFKTLAPTIPLLFEEPNPAPVKYCLEKLNLITSSEIRLPLLEITDNLKTKLDFILK
ncbi:MAG: 4-hydroxy-tetrahydrodipicolinate synthase [Clostridiaceae bacterium]